MRIMCGLWHPSHLMSMQPLKAWFLHFGQHLWVLFILDLILGGEESFSEMPLSLLTTERISLRLAKTCIINFWVKWEKYIFFVVVITIGIFQNLSFLLDVFSSLTSIISLVLKFSLWIFSFSAWKQILKENNPQTHKTNHLFFIIFFFKFTWKRMFFDIFGSCNEVAELI